MDWELRSAADARPGTCAGSLRPARAIYNWFAEGFATKDLKDAKALLDDLADARVLAANTGIVTSSPSIDRDSA